MCFDQRDNVGELGRVGKGVVHCREIVSDESVEETRFECNVVHVSEGVEGCHWNNLGFVFAVFYGLFYAALDIKAGSFTAVLTFLSWVGASFVANSIGYELAWKVVLAAQLFCWTGQFIGHGVFEKRAPALLDNLAQAFLMAPFFVVLEILQSSIGYEPYPGFQKKVQARIDANIKEWKEKQQKKIS